MAIQEIKDTTTQYHPLYRDIWRVSVTEDTPNVSAQRLLDGFKAELPRLGMPVEVDLADLTTSAGQETRVLIKHTNPTYSLLHIFLGLQDFGNFVFASQYNWVVNPPERPSRLSQPAPSLDPIKWAVGAGLLLTLCGFVGVARVPFILIGLLAIGAGIYLFTNYQKNTQEYQQVRRDWEQRLADYWSKIDRSLFNEYDTEVYRLTSATEAVMERVLQQLFPQSTGLEREKQGNAEEARAALRKKREMHSGASSPRLAAQA